MGRRTGFEAYPKYQNYLHQTSVWPSESGGAEIGITSMAPRYANSARAKLMRWAAGMGAQAALNIYDRDERLAYVANSPLAKILDTWANDVPYIDPVDAAEVTPRDIILAFAPVVAEHTNLDITAIFKLCEALATKADDEWTITVQSR